MELRKKENRPKFVKKEFWGRVATSRRNKTTPKETEKAKKYLKELEKWKRNEESYWEIEEILDKRTTPTGGVEVLIKWDGWPSKFNTWEPVENLNDDLPVVLEKLKKQKEEKLNKQRKCPGRRKKNGKAKRSDSPQWGEIEEVRDRRVRNGRTYYLIKWKDCPEESNTWELEDNLTTINLEALKSRIFPSDEPEPEHTIIQIPLKLLENSKEDISEQKIQEELTNNSNQQSGQVKGTPLIEDLEPVDDNTNTIYPKEVALVSRQSSRVSERIARQRSTYLNRGFSMEEEANKQADLSKVFLPESMFFNIGPEDKTTYRHSITTHRSCNNGEIEAFHIVVSNKFDSSVLPISFWCDFTDARIKYPVEVMEYLVKTRFTNLGSVPLYD